MLLLSVASWKPELVWRIRKDSSTPVTFCRSTDDTTHTHIRGHIFFPSSSHLPALDQLPIAIGSNFFHLAFGERFNYVDDIAILPCAPSLPSPPPHSFSYHLIHTCVFTFNTQTNRRLSHSLVSIPFPFERKPMLSNVNGISK